MSLEPPTTSPIASADNASPPGPLSDRPRIQFRVILIGLLFIPLCCYWAQDQTNDRIFSLMIPPVILTLLLVIVNSVVRKFAPRLAMSQGELLVFYGMQAVACAMASEWTDVIATSIYSYALYPDTGVHRSVVPFLNRWLFFRSASGLKDFAAGGRSFGYFYAHLGPWWPKILAWTALVGVVSFAMLCINALMAEQWIARERLSFPIVQLPLAMTATGGPDSLWRSPVFWYVGATMFALDMYNGLAYFYPQLPPVPTRYLGDLSTAFTSPPWNQTGWMPVGIFPFIFGIALLMPTDLILSCVVFFFLRKGMQALTVYLGYSCALFGGSGTLPQPPYFSEQSWGAFLGLFVLAMLGAQPYLKEVWQNILHGGKGRPDRVSPRFAFFGLIASLIALGAIGVMLGVPLGIVMVYAFLFLAFSLALTRLRAQFGVPTHEMAFMGPNQMLLDFHGSQSLSQTSVVNTVASFEFMNRIHRTHPMPNQMEALYVGDRGKVSARDVFSAIVLATIAGSVCGLLTKIYLGYHILPTQGGSGSEITTLIRTPQTPNASGMLAVVIGFCVVLLLNALRSQFAGFVLHPAAYALALNFGLDYYWFGLTLAWIVKAFTLRYGGVTGNQNLRLIAFGLILGEFVAETIWAVYSMLNHDQLTYSISINGKMNWQQ